MDNVNYVLSVMILPAVFVCFSCCLANIQTKIQFLLLLCHLVLLHCFCWEKVKSLTHVQKYNLIRVGLGDVGGQEIGPSPSLSTQKMSTKAFKNSVSKMGRKTT